MSDEVREEITNWEPTPGGPENLRAVLTHHNLNVVRNVHGHFVDELTRDLVGEWVQNMGRKTDPDTNYAYSSRRVAELSGGLISHISVSTWWGSARQPQEVSADVRREITNWEPTPEGPKDLRAVLIRHNLDVVRKDRGGLRDKLTRELVREWAQNMGRKTDPDTNYGYTARRVAALSGGLINRSSVSEWWKSARQPQEVSADVRREITNWEPTPEGPKDLRAVLTHHNLNVDRNGRGGLADKLTRELVREWAQNLGRKTDPDTHRRRYTTTRVAELSGGLASHTSVSTWWGSARESQPAREPQEVSAEVRREITQRGPESGSRRHEVVELPAKRQAVPDGTGLQGKKRVSGQAGPPGVRHLGQAHAEVTYPEGPHGDFSALAPAPVRGAAPATVPAV
ncbi:hypothetical protein ACWDKQ_36265, partial [Saccharopolyspora sp. NPDC000995]